MEVENLIESFSEFKEVKNIDRETMMNILEDVTHDIPYAFHPKIFKLLSAHMRLQKP